MKVQDLTTVLAPCYHLLGLDQSATNNLVWSLNTCTSSQIVMCRMLRGKKMGSLQKLYDEFAAALQFPYYFGDNIPALDECLADLEWLPADAYILFIFDSPLLLVSESQATLTVVLETLRDVQETWNTKHPATSAAAGSGIPFHVVFQCLPSEIQPFMLKLRLAFPDIILDILDC